MHIVQYILYTRKLLAFHSSPHTAHNKKLLGNISASQPLNQVNKATQQTINSCVKAVRLCSVSLLISALPEPSQLLGKDCQQNSQHASPLPGRTPPAGWHLVWQEPDTVVLAGPDGSQHLLQMQCQVHPHTLPGCRHNGSIAVCILLIINLHAGLL